MAVRASVVTSVACVLVWVYAHNASVCGCFSSGWETLFEDLLLSDLCPILSSASSTVNEVMVPLVDEPLITPELVSESFKCGRELTKSAQQRANQLVRSGVTLDACSPAMLHFFSASLPADAKKASTLSDELISATKILQMKVCSNSDVTPNTFLSFLENNPVRPRDAKCKPAAASCAGADKYRTIDGTGNNPRHPAWGRRGAPFTRLTAPRYADGIYAMPVSASGRPLPNARALSTGLFAEPLPGAAHSRSLTALSMQWGQLVTHDLVFQAMETTDEGGIQCCLGEGRDVLPPALLNDKCIPICVPEDDPFYQQHGIRCLNFVRSVTVPRDDCSLGYAEQMNTVTSFLDGSPIYSCDPKLAAKLRSKTGGRLREETRKHCKGSFLPSVDDKSAVCDLRNSSEPCYLAGDARVNQTPTLAALHTLLLREHNRVADTLAALNPLWTDEKLYQEARKVVIAEIQHITYHEWLPLNFGESYLRYYRITPTSLYSRDYNEEVNPGAINGFGAAAFRFLHSVIPGTVMSCPAASRTAYLHKLSDHYFNPSLLEGGPESLDELMRGLVTQRAGEADPHCSAEITNLLFKSYNQWGLDLLAMDIQRGRDHGIASYNDYREICGLQRANTFQDLSGEISQDRIEALARLYEAVDDVDLLAGGALEAAAAGSLLGPTLQCVVAEQFYRTRVGDRHFYDNGELPHSFTPDQLKELKKASMARLICDNTGVRFVQRRAFQVESPDNPRYSCQDHDAIPRVDLTPWKRPKFELCD